MSSTVHVFLAGGEKERFKAAPPRKNTSETHTDEDVSTLTQVVLLHLADVAVQRTVSKQHQHGGTGTLLDGRHHMGRVSHHSVLVLRDLGAEEDPGLVLDVEDPQLAGHVSRRVDLSPVHVDLPLGKKQRSLVSLEVPAVVHIPPQQELN